MSPVNPLLGCIGRCSRWGVICLTLWLAGANLTTTGIAWAAPAAEHPSVTETAPAADAQHAADHKIIAPPLYSILPFAALLAAIALLPLSYKTAHWWEHNSSKLMVSAACGLITFLFYAALYGHGIHDHGTGALAPAGIPAAIAVLKNSILVEYIPFMVLLFSLYVISGGINIAGSLRGTPQTNTIILFIGSVVASFVGTTGAAMVLIRPLLKANANRDFVSHTVVFFIFVVCNTGGCLLPIGDPPLFLGYLRGVPFFWTLQLAPHWALMNGVLLAVYFAWDCYYFRKEKTEVIPAAEPFGIRGQFNFLLLFAVIVCVAILDPSKPVPGTNFTAPIYLREGLMLALAGVSVAFTSRSIRQANSFNYDAIVEVGVLFVGIFICMQAPIQILNVHGAALGIDEPWKFYWCTGILSSFLDNAPTYVVFFETAKTVPATSPLVEAVGVGSVELAAISLGAVFMGSMTYIGNGPNLMVKAIAEKSNVRMPSFFGYMLYSCSVVLPASIVLTLVFFR
ncbi:MAG: sodium:proton antiporter [Planctomycetota bacterium]